MNSFAPYPLEAVEAASEHDLFSTLLRSMKSRLISPEYATDEATSTSLEVSTVPSVALDQLVWGVEPLSLGHSQDIEHTLYLALNLPTVCGCTEADDGHLQKVMIRCASMGQNFESSDQPQFGVLFHAARAQCVRIGCAHVACHHETDIKVEYASQRSPRTWKDSRVDICTAKRQISCRFLPTHHTSQPKCHTIYRPESPPHYPTVNFPLPIYLPIYMTGHHLLSAVQISVVDVFMQSLLKYRSTDS